MEIETPNLSIKPIISEVIQPYLTLETLENEPGYYKFVIRPMLLPGHEGELCTWLKEMGLLQRTLRCQNSGKIPPCDSLMRWSQARIMDKYQWKCNYCDKKRAIRDDSFFKDTKCNLTTTIRVILGWCKDIPSKELAALLNTRDIMIKKLYSNCAQIAENYVKNHPTAWRVGGDETIVVIDLYPDGCAKISGSNPEYQNNNPTQILCIAEIKTIPTNYWFHVLTSTDTESAREEALRVVRTMVRPGSILIADPNAKVCSYDELKNLKQYSNVISIQDLMVHNKPGNTVLENLETIWQSAVLICEEAQNYSQTEVQSYLYNMMWRRKFSKTALESLLHHIADNYPTHD